MLAVALHLRGQELSLRDIAGRLVIATGKRKGQHPSPATVAALRAEGRTVLVHCTDAVSRTPAVAALYAARNLGIPVHQALRDVRAVLPAAQASPAFMAALDRLGEAASAPQKRRPRIWRAFGLKPHLLVMYRPTTLRTLAMNAGSVHRSRPSTGPRRACRYCPRPPRG